MSSHRLVVLGALAAWVGCTAVPPEAPSTVSSPRTARRHVVAAVKLTAQGPRVVARRVVDGPAQIDRAPERTGWRVQVVDADGAVLHSELLRPVTEVRGEFPRADGTMEKVSVPVTEPVVTLRLPVLPGAARLRLLDERQVWDAQGKLLEREPAPLAELDWAEVMP